MLFAFGRPEEHLYTPYKTTRRKDPSLKVPRHTRPPEKEETPASRYLRSRPTTYTPYKTTRRRKDLSLKVPMLTPYYVHVIQDHQKTKKRTQPQCTDAHALLRTGPTRPPEEEKSLASRYLRSRSTTYMPYKPPKCRGACQKGFRTL